MPETQDALLNLTVILWPLAVLAAGFLPCLAEFLMAALHWKAAQDIRRDLAAPPDPVASSLDPRQRLRQRREVRHLVCCGMIYLILGVERFVETLAHYTVHLSPSSNLWS
jgi:hypothetical protein